MIKQPDKKSRSLLGWVLGVLGLGALSTAYLDPGSGGFLIQVLVASILGAGLLIRAFWNQILGLFGRKPKTSDEAPDTDKSE